MNEGNSLLILWVKTIATSFNIIKSDEKNLLTLLYDDDFIFSFFTNFFTRIEEESSESIVEVLSLNVRKYFEMFCFSRSQMKNIHAKIFDNWGIKEAKFKIWNLFFTMAYFFDFYEFYEFYESYPHQPCTDLNNMTHYSFSNFCKFSNIPQVCKPRYLMKSAIITKSILNIVYEVLSEIEIDFFDFQGELAKIFHEETLNETVFYLEGDLESQSKRNNDSFHAENYNNNYNNTPINSSRSPISPSSPVKNNGSPNLSFVEDYTGNLNSRRSKPNLAHCEDCYFMKLKLDESNNIVTNLKERNLKQEQENISLLNYNTVLLEENKELLKSNNQLKLLKNQFEKHIEEYKKEKSIFENIVKVQIENIEKLELEKSHSTDYKQLFSELTNKFGILLKENSNLKSNLSNFQNVHIGNLNIYSLEKKDEIISLEQELNMRNETIKSLSGKLEGKEAKIQLLAKKVENENKEVNNLKMIILIMVLAITLLLNWNNS